MTDNIKLQMKRVFGNDRIYPACPVSNALIKLKEKIIIGASIIINSSTFIFYIPPLKIYQALLYHFPLILFVLN